MSKARTRREEEKPLEANLFPVLSCMFLLIPALLLAMEVATMVAIHVTPPRFSSDPGATSHSKEDLALSVHVRSDGFATKIGTAGAAIEIPLQAGTHDYGGLEHWAAKIKAAHPDITRVTVSAENDVVMQTLVETMDALRGRECRLAPAFRGEMIADECLLWHPVVSSGPLT
jgi:biopolymer transport protein ExbD